MEKKIKTDKNLTYPTISGITERAFPAITEKNGIIYYNTRI
jgi:hypothetical protein